MKVNKIPLVLFILVVFYTSGLFIAPLTLEPGTISELHGGANRLSNMELWRELSPYHALIYTFSDFNCHQMHERSYTINGNQMPVCARCVGIFIGFTLGLLVMMFIKAEDDYKDILLKLVPIRTQHISGLKKTVLLVVMGLLFILPMALDGFLQLLTDYESNNPMRTLTGFTGGLVFSLFIAALLMASVHSMDTGKENTYIEHDYSTGLEVKK